MSYSTVLSNEFAMASNILRYSILKVGITAPVA
jgi:hypothetical protein